VEALAARYPGLASFPHVDLGVRPTPVEEHRIDGLRILVKRDDLSAPGYGGNKVRALEFLLARPARRVLTISTAGAHHAYATARYAATLGLETTAVLVRQGPRGPTRDALEALGTKCVEVNGPVGAAVALARRWRPGTLFVPPGGMTAHGALGYLVAALEFDPVPERIYVPLGTGTTVSGLLAGLMLRRARCEVVGVRVADAIAGWPVLLWRRAFGALALVRGHHTSLPGVRPRDVRLRVIAATGEYGEATPEAVAAVKAARPLVLEPTYTGKALAVLLSERDDGAGFLHTYGTVAPDEAAGIPESR